MLTSKNESGTIVVYRDGQRAGQLAPFMDDPHTLGFKADPGVNIAGWPKEDYDRLCTVLRVNSEPH